MSTYRHHLDLANERFDLAEQMFGDGKEHTAAHLYINAVINYHNAACQKFLSKIPSHKGHADASYFKNLSEFLGKDLHRYKDSYIFLVSHKGKADYGVGMSSTVASQIRSHAQKIREIIEPIL